jgi:hypothetical protein
MRCHELKAYKWWLIFERARRYEMRRNPSAFLEFMAQQELNLHEAAISSPDLVARVLKMKGTRKCQEI